MKEEHVRAYWEARARIEPIAARLGLDYDEGNRDLMYALRSIAELVGEAGLKPPRAMQPAVPVRAEARHVLTPSRDQRPAASAGRDMGDRVVEVMAARRGRALGGGAPGNPVTGPTENPRMAAAQIMASRRGNTLKNQEAP